MQPIQLEITLLQMVQAVALNEQNQKSIAICILFDSGSQRTYITKNLRDKLNLKPTRQERLHLTTFGDRNFSTRRCDIAYNLDQAIQLEFLPCVSQ